MKRSPMRRGTRRVGQRAAERRAAGGKRAVGRPSVSVEAWEAMVATLYIRARGRCENPLCRRALNWDQGGRRDPHHVQKASQGGPDALSNLTALCPRCHNATDRAYVRGRLVLAPAAGVDPEQAVPFTFAVRYARHDA